MREFKKIFVLLIMFLMVSAFKSNTTFTINENKSLNIEIELLISDSQVNDESHSVMSTKAQSYEDNGWKVVNINEDGYTGYKVTKTINNIDELNKYSEDINIANILDKNFELNKLFKVERSFFKNTYTVRYNYLFDESKFLTKSSTLTPSQAQVVVVEAVTNPDEDNADASDIFNVKDETVLTYKVILPVSALESNASSSENENKELVWNLVPTENNVINYSFEMYYKTKVLIVGIGSVVFFLIIIIIIIIIHKKNSSKEVLIHADYDPSIAGAIAETTTDQIPHAQGSLEIPDMVNNQQDINNQNNNLMQ